MAKERLENGLTIDQNLVIQGIAATSNWKRACDAAGIPHDRFRAWIRRDPAFRKAFEELNGEAVEAVRRQLESSAQRAAEAFDDALDATKDMTVETKCPSCGADIKIVAEVPDHSTRLKAGEVVLKVNKVLKEVTEMEGRVTVAALPLHMQLALAAYERGDRIPPGYERELRDMGFIKGQLPPGTVDAEYVEVSQDEEGEQG